MDLKRENQKLKSIVKDKLVEAAPELLSTCQTEIPSIVTESIGDASTVLERPDFNLMEVRRKRVGRAGRGGEEGRGRGCSGGRGSGQLWVVVESHNTEGSNSLTTCGTN